MKNIGLALLLIGCLSACGPSMKDVNVLEGKWRNMSFANASFEEWKKLENGHYNGESYMQLGETKLTAQTVQIIDSEEGVTYVAQSSPNDASINFMLVHTDSALVFNNPTNGFPKNIIYKMVTADSMVKIISNDERRQVFQFKKAS